MFKLLGKGYEYIQDNASIHCAGKVKAWFQERGIILLEGWPPYCNGTSDHELA